MIALFMLEQRFLKRNKSFPKRREFFITDKDLAQLSDCSRSTIRRSIQRLKYIGLISYERGCGYTRRATRYTIRLDPFYLL